MKKWGHINKRIKHLKDLNLKTMYDLTYRKWGKIHVNINKNPELADKIRNETTEYFEKTKP